MVNQQVVEKVNTVMRWMVSTAYYKSQPGNFRLIKQKIEDTYQMFN